jgi:hypothetical protein
VDVEGVVKHGQIDVVIAKGVRQHNGQLSEPKQRESGQKDSDDGVVVTEHGVRVGNEQHVDEEDEVEDVEEGKGDGHGSVVVEDPHVGNNLRKDDTIWWDLETRMFN